MRESLPLGRIAGIRVGMNWSVLVVFFLITAVLAAGRFPTLYPERSTTAYVGAGLVAGLLFLASLLAHEVSHAVVARRHGVEVHGITLWMLGGVAQVGGHARSPGAELRIAGVGPLVSLLLAGGFFAVELLLDAVGVGGLVTGTMRWLAVINLVLAVFNVFPAAPLDGGRLLTALLWRRRGNRASAAITAARAGRVFGFVLVGLGVVELMVGAAGGLWLILLGGFLASAAAIEEQQTKLQSALGDVRVGDVMTPNPQVVPADVSVAEFLDHYVLPNRYSSFPLVEDGRPVGLATLNRIKDVPAEERSRTPVRAVACTDADLVRLSPEDSLSEAFQQLQGCADGRAVVVRGDRLVGILSPSDISRQAQISALRTSADDRSGGHGDRWSRSPSGA